MKRILLVLTVGALVAYPTILKAEDPSAPPPGGPPPGGHHHDMSFLTEAEKAELKKAHDAALAADPNLAAEDKANMEAMQAIHQSGQKPTPEEMEKGKAFHEKLDAAMIKIDPAVAPIIEKIKAHHHGPPPPPATGA